MDNIPLDWKKIRAVLVAIAAILGLLLGVINYITPQLPSGEIQALGVTNFDSITLSGDLNAANVTASSAVSGATFDGSSSLAINGVTFSGPIKFGTAANYTSGAAITHGFATTPTVCLMEPARDVTSTLTIGATTFSSNRATQATPIYWVCGK